MTLSNDWRAVRNNWGHRLHGLCPYMAAFPPRLPHYFLEKFTRPGDVVLDPFCGGGATPLQACLAGRIGIGVDLNPLACLVTRAKLEPPPLAHAESRLRALESDLFFGDAEEAPESIRMLFHPRTLRQLVYLKQVLDLDDPCDNFLAAAILGVLHGKNDKDGRRPSFLSVPMSNRVSMSPDYLREHVRKYALKPRPIDVFAVLRRKMRRLLGRTPRAAQGFVYCDSVERLARIANPYLRDRAVKLVITAPPPPRAVKYGSSNWLRLWFLGHDPAALDRTLTSSARLKGYLAFIKRSLRAIYSVLAPGGVCCLAVGDVRDRRTGEPISLADEIWKALERSRSKFQRYDIVEDRLSETPADRVLVLYRDSIEELTDEVDWDLAKKHTKAKFGVR